MSYREVVHLLDCAAEMPKVWREARAEAVNIVLNDDQEQSTEYLAEMVVRVFEKRYQESLEAREHRASRAREARARKKEDTTSDDSDLSE